MADIAGGAHVVEQEVVEEESLPFGVISDKMAEYLSGADGEEVNPDIEVGVVGFDPSGGGFSVVGAPQAPSSQPAAKESVSLSEPAETATKAETITAAPEPVTQVVLVEDVPRKLTKTVFTGAFGVVKAAYLDIYKQGNYLTLVSKADADFTYAPPISEDEFTVEVGGQMISVISPGIMFDMPSQGLEVLVLLIT